MSYPLHCLLIDVAGQGACAPEVEVYDQHLPNQDTRPDQDPAAPQEGGQPHGAPHMDAGGWGKRQYTFF